MINTTHGPMSEADLEMKFGREELPDHYEEWVEYWHNGECVHRSIHLKYKYTLQELMARAG